MNTRNCVLAIALITVTCGLPVGLMAADSKSAPPAAPPTSAQAEKPSALYDIVATSIDGKKQPLAAYKGQVVLAVNTASRCGFTPQYKDLEKLYKDYGSKGFTVLGFPSNDFNNMEPGTNAEIKKFCALRFGVTFPLFARDHVSGGEKQAVFKYLTDQEDPELNGDVEWNFEKFLLDKQGRVRARFGSHINPGSTRITSQIEKLLNE